jgi:hypothetical protein
LKIKFKGGKVVEIVEEYGPEQNLRAAELADVPAEMQYSDSLILNIATIMVAVKTVDGKTVEDLVGDKTKARDMLLQFRKAFTDGEWQGLAKAINEVFPSDPKPEAYEVLTS